MSLFSSIFGGGDGYDPSAMIQYANKALKLQKEMYNDQKERTEPFYDVGVGALDKLKIAMGLGDDPNAEGAGSLMDTFGLEDFQADPGYQFTKSEGEKAINRSAAAKSNYYSPATDKALAKYNTNLANATYNDAYNRFNNDQTNIFNRLASTTGFGQTANSTLNNASSNYANNASNLYTQMGNAITGANAAQNADDTSMFNTLVTAGAYMYSDERLKEDIEKVGEKNGVEIYRYKFKGSPQVYEGVIAQKVQITHPDAVREVDGYLAVDYDKLGVEQKEISDGA